jgi:hypothetical protein
MEMRSLGLGEESEVEITFLADGGSERGNAQMMAWASIFL